MTGRALRFTLGGALALAGTAALGALSWVPYTAERVDHAVIRLAWRARGERVRQCRRLSPEELAKLPQHMRQEEVCERRILPYRLQVAVDGTPVVDELVRAGGAREDRPLFVFHELPVAPGTHTVHVTFVRQGALERPGQAAERAEDVDEFEARRRKSDTPPRLELDRSVTLPVRRIVLITYDDEQKTLRLAGGS